MDMTVRQISEELGVSRQKIYRYIETHSPAAHYKASGKTMYFDEREIRKMKSFFGIEEEETDTEELSAENSLSLSRLRELELENQKLREDLERNEARIGELLLQRTELLKALRSSNNCIRRLTASVRDLSRDLRCSHQLCAQMLRKNIKKRPSFPYAGLGRFLGSLTGRFRKGH